MNRREFCQWSVAAPAIATLGPSLLGRLHSFGQPTSNRLYFDRSDTGRIKANTRSPFLAPLYQEWSSHPPSALGETLDRFDSSGDIIRDFLAALDTLTKSALTQLVEPDTERRESILAGLERFIEIPNWDYFHDGPNNPIGIQRASAAIVRLLFAREVLDRDIDSDLDKRLLQAIAEKGCLPCYRTVYGMDHPDTVKGWQFDERHAGYYDIDMSRWPTILGGNNLRAAPSAALGLGAIALLESDPRAGRWLDTAVASSRRVLNLFSPDGSYFEGLSYAGYTLRTTLGFCEAHQRCVGNIDWAQEANMKGIIEFTLASQMGKQTDGSPDIVNFSDARNSIYPCVASWIARHANDPLAQYAAEEASKPFYFLDFLWYEPKRKRATPPKRLENIKNDLDWVLCHSGWGPDDGIVAFKSGGPANHEHADRNSFIFKIYGERLLNDNFGAAYDRRHDHWLLRHTAAHNAVLVDGKGNHYHDGIEGTNESLSYANITQYQDRGDTVWWTSDATPAYRIENEHIFKVVRTVLYAKPNIVVVLDQIRLRYRPQPVEIRYFPDNRDNRAILKIDDNRFQIQRPRAMLQGEVFSDSTARVYQSKLNLPEEHGEFPYLAIDADEALSHDILTVMSASPSKSARSSKIQASATEDGWQIKVGSLKANISINTLTPEVSIG